jgi:hypothetical protein
LLGLDASQLPLLSSTQTPQLDKATADAAEFKAGYDKLTVDAVEQKAQVNAPVVRSAPCAGSLSAFLFTGPLCHPN